MNRVIITEMNSIRYLLIYEDDILVECHPLLEEDGIRIGNIYLGRVQKKLKNIDAAFISLDGENVGYLPLDDKPAIVLNRKLPKGLSSIAENDLILVQVVQEPQKMKQARVTGNISISGKYIVLDLNEGSIGVSKRIRDEKFVRHLKGLINCDDHKCIDIKEGHTLSCHQNSSDSNDNILTKFRYGLVYRTACENALDEAIVGEYECLSHEFTDIILKASFERRIGIIHKEKQEYISIIEAYGFDRIAEIKTDIPDIYNEIIGYFKDSNIEYNIHREKQFVKKSDTEEINHTDCHCQINISMYNDNDYPYYKLLGLERAITDILNKKVWLKSGGFLIIEPTEAMVVIDVNTGKSINKKERDKHVLKINLEAAEEIALHIRLRNLSGIIMIDFINMKSDEDKQRIAACLRNAFSKDKVSTHFIEITKLDVFEITRKKQRRPLHEVLQYRDNKISIKNS